MLLAQKYISFDCFKKGTVALKQFLDVRLVIAIAILLVLLSFSSAHAYYTVLGTDDITDWEYSSTYNSNWLNESFVSGWSKGDTAFGRSTFSPITVVNQNQVYIRKILQLNDSTQGIIKVVAENNLKCYVNGNLIAEKHKTLYAGPGMYQCYSNYFQSGCRTGTAYYYGTYDAINDFIIADVSKYLKKGTNVIACEAWADKNAYYYKSGYKKYYTDGRLYLDVNFYSMGTKSLMWSKTDTDYNKLSDNPVMFHVKQQCVSDYECGYSSARTHAIIMEDRWSGAWQWGDAPITDGNYFKWTDTRKYPRTTTYIDPIWPYASSNLYLRKWIWSDENKTMSLQISDTKLPECYVNEKKASFTNLSAPYWIYSADIQLSAGQNLIACKSPKAAANSFDLRIVEPNGVLSITDVSADVSEFKTGEPATFTVTLANASHPETDVALMLEAWGATDYQEILTTATSSAATITFTPIEEGDYDLLFTAKDMIDSDTATYSSLITISPLVPVELNVLGFFPTEGNSDESGKSAGSTAILIGLGAAAAGAATLGSVYLVSGKGSGFSLNRTDASLSRASNAMNTLNAMSNTKAAANSNSFWNTMIQRYDDFKSKWNAIEEEKRKLKEAEKEAAKRRAAIEVKDAQFKVKAMLAAPLGKGESLKDKYNQVNAFMNSKGISSAGEEYEKFKKFNEDSEAGRMDLSDPSWHWSATRMIEQQKAEQAKNAAALNNQSNLQTFNLTNSTGLINPTGTHSTEPYYGVETQKQGLLSKIFGWLKENALAPPPATLVSFNPMDAINSGKKYGEMYTPDEYAKLGYDVVYDENGKPVAFKEGSYTTMQELSAIALTQIVGTYALNWLGKLKLPFGTKTTQVKGTGELTRQSGAAFEKDTAKLAEEMFGVKPDGLNQKIKTSQGSTDIDIPLTKPDGTKIHIESKKNVQAGVDSYIKKGYSKKEAMDIVANKIKMQIDKYHAYDPDAEVYVRLDNAPQYVIDKLKSWGIKIFGE